MLKKILFILPLILIGCMGSYSYANNCTDLYIQEKYREAFDVCKHKAEKEDASAQSTLGMIYYHGNGTAQDYKKAIYWLKKSAEAGNISGQHNLGLIYLDGKALPKDDNEAFKWYLKAAEQGAAISQARVAEMYILSQGVEKNEKQALYWAQRSAEQHNAIGELLLGQFYGGQIKELTDYKRAIVWFKKSADQNNPSAQYMVGVSHLTDKRGANKNFIEAYKWFLLAVNNSNYLSMNEKKSAADLLKKIEKIMPSDDIDEARKLANQWKPVIIDSQGKYRYNK